MNIALIGLITTALGGLAVFRSSAFALALMCCMALLGAASAMSFGPANITPGYLSIGFFTLAVMIRVDAFRYIAHVLVQGRAGIYLIALSAWALMSSQIMPRLFAGEFLIFPMNSVTKTIIEVPLYPSSANFTQAVYFISGPVIFALVSSMARNMEVMKRAAFALIIASIVNLIIVLLDTVTFAIGLSSALDFIRNADYAQLFSHQFMGIKRVTGAFPEASAYAGTAVTLFAFNFRLWRGGVFSNLTGPVSLLTFITILFSFSSSGYAALFLYLALAYAGVISGLEDRGSSSPEATRNRILFFALGPMLGILIAIALALNPALLDPVIETFDSRVTNKLGSASGIERTAWNTSGLNAFFETAGLGAGTGSVRTSSFVVGIMANLGVIGMLLFGVFLARLFTSKPEQYSDSATYEAKQIASAARAGCFTCLVGAAVVATSIDLGILFYVCAGLTCASAFYRTDLPRQDRDAQVPG